MKLRFGQIESVLQAVHRIPEPEHVHFRARLRNLKRAGFKLPGGGAGRRANFDHRDLIKLAFVAELMQVGLPPEKVVKAVDCSWGKFVSVMLANRRYGPGSDLWSYLVADLNALTDEFPRFRTEIPLTLSLHLKAEPLNIRRMLIVNPGAVLNDVVAALNGAGIDEAEFSACMDTDEQTYFSRGLLQPPTTGG